MKVTIEPTKHHWVSRGIQRVRLWHGTTETGDPVLVAVIGVAGPQGTIVDDYLQAVPPGQPAPVDGVGPNGRTVLAANDGDILHGWWWI